MTDDLVFPAAGVVERLELGGWTINPAGRPGVLALNSGHYFADGDGVTVLLRMSGDDALVSDGGTMKIRLADAQVELSNERARNAWESTLRDFGLQEVGDRIVGRKPADQLVSLLTDVVDAMLTLDGYRSEWRPEWTGPVGAPRTPHRVGASVRAGHDLASGGAE